MAETNGQRPGERAVTYVGTRTDPPGRRGQGDGPRPLRRRLQPARPAGRPRAAQPAPARAHRLDRHLEGREAARREGGRHPRRLRGPAVRVHPGRRDDDELQGRGAERHGAREGPLRGPRGGRGGRDQRGDRPAGAQADRGRSTRCCPHVIDVVEAMQPGAPLLHDDLFTVGVEPKPDKPSNIAKRIEIELGDVEAGFKKADLIVEREFKTAPGAPGLHRAARRPWPASPRTAQAELWTTTQGHCIVRAHCARLLGLGHRQGPRHRHRDRRRLRRQDRGLSRAARARAVARRPSGR